MLFKLAHLTWLASLAAGLVLLLGLAVGLIDRNTWVGSEWQWDENPLATLPVDKALLCLQVPAAPRGPLQLMAQDGEGHQQPVVFWDNQRGRCAAVAVNQVGHLWLLPQLHHLFISEASVTIWNQDHSWRVRPLAAEPGGWKVQ